MRRHADAPGGNRGAAVDGAGSGTSRVDSITLRTAILDTRSGEITFGAAPAFRPMAGRIPKPGNVGRRAVRRSVQRAYERRARKAVRRW